MHEFFPSGIKCLFLFCGNRYIDSEKRFQHVLEACGVYKSLMKLGVKEGDTVIVGEVCFNDLIICHSRFHVVLYLSLALNIVL